jgi:hypothetical protein
MPGVAINMPICCAGYIFVPLPMFGRVGRGCRVPARLPRTKFWKGNKTFFHSKKFNSNMDDTADESFASHIIKIF